jgi:hypothetical protein
MPLDAALGVLEPEGPNGTGTRWRGPEAAPPAGLPAPPLPAGLLVLSPPPAVAVIPAMSSSNRVGRMNRTFL